MPRVDCGGSRKGARMKTRTLVLSLGFCAALVYPLVPSIGHAAKEICDNGIDDDGDKAIDCEDSDCSGDPSCKEPPPKAVCHNIGGPDEKGGGANCDPNVDE